MRKRDRYQSAFGAGMPGIRSATYDIGLVLYLLAEIAKREELLRLRTPPDRDGQSFTVAQLLEIAHDALNTSVTPVTWIYERLQQNEEAAEAVSRAEIAYEDPDGVLLDSRWALALTLSNKAILPRSMVSRAYRIIAKREVEAARLASVAKTLDESPVECERCGAVVVEYPLKRVIVGGVEQQVCWTCQQALEQADQP